MTLVEAPQQFTTDDAVELIWERVLAGEFTSVAEAVRALWSEMHFAPEDRDFLAIMGLTDLAESEQRARRHGYTPRVAWGAPHGKKWERYMALTWPYEAADGTQKPLLEFTLSDLAALSVAAGKIADAARRKQEWATLASERLNEHGKARIADLPDMVLREIDTAAREALGRQA